MIRDLAYFAAVVVSALGVGFGMSQVPKRDAHHPVPVPAPSWASPLLACTEVVEGDLYSCPDGNSWQFAGSTQGKGGAEVPNGQ